ncbi:hypothetical protein SEA_MILANI_44 [Microbacterium phage Milani]|nr:hypothetical protein SEA_MILANI_44 [Microbacterium phage Milani]
MDECKDNYVVTCNPAPPVYLPECEDGWEIGNGTAVCATPEPMADLAPTGGEVPFAVFGLAVALLAAGVVATVRGRRR